MPPGGNLSDILERLRKVEDQINDLRRFQAWLIGLGIGSGAIIGLLVDTIKKKLGL